MFVVDAAGGGAVALESGITEEGGIEVAIFDVVELDIERAVVEAVTSGNMKLVANSTN